MPRLEFGRPVEADYGALALLNLAGSFETDDAKWEQAKHTYGHEYLFDNIRRVTSRLKQLMENKGTMSKVRAIAAAADEGAYTTYTSLLIERAYPEQLPSMVDDIECDKIRSVMRSIKEEIFGDSGGGTYTDLFSGLMQGKFKFNDKDQMDFDLI